VDLQAIDVSAAFDQFKRLADKKKDVYDKDLFDIVGKQTEAAARFELVDVNCSSSLRGMPTATVTLHVEGAPRSARAGGDGMVDACYRAITEATGLSPRLENYQVQGITGGTDAIGEVTCMVRLDDAVVRGHGSHTDIIMASAYAFVDALNRLVARAGDRGASEQVVGP
jgi:2-isopropylmalate synthase